MYIIDSTSHSYLLRKLVQTIILILGNCFENNVDRHHNGFQSTKNSATDCQLWCQEIQYCKYFTWRKDNKECWLTNEQGIGDHNENAISGPKFC